MPGTIYQSVDFIIFTISNSRQVFTLPDIRASRVSGLMWRGELKCINNSMKQDNKKRINLDLMVGPSSRHSAAFQVNKKGLVTRQASVIYYQNYKYL